MKALAVLILGILFSSIVSAEIYRWTDDSGRVHFSDTAPAKKAEVVELKQKKGSANPSSNYNSVENTKRFLKELEEESAAKQEKAKALEKKQAKIRAYCQRLEKEIAIYNKGYAIVRFNKKGEHEYLTDREIAANKSKFEQKWKERCVD